MFCAYRDALGKPGIGFHKMRVPYTDTALNDYAGTLLLAWLLAALSGINLVNATLFMFLLGILLHYLFCVRIGA